MKRLIKPYLIDFIFEIVTCHDFDIALSDFDCGVLVDVSTDLSHTLTQHRHLYSRSSIVLRLDSRRLYVAKIDEA